MMRTFIGIKVQLDSALWQIVGHLKEKLAGERINWVADENLHVTLHFLGETSLSQLAKVVDLMSKYVAGLPPFSFQMQGLAYFRRRSVPSALFFGLHKKEELVDLAMNLKSELQKMGFASGQTFKPHLTIGRIKYLSDKLKFDKVMGQLGDTEQQVVIVKEIILYESILKPSGPVYKPINVFHLTG